MRAPDQGDHFQPMRFDLNQTPSVFPRRAGFIRIRVKGDNDGARLAADNSARFGHIERGHRVSAIVGTKAGGFDHVVSQWFGLAEQFLQRIIETVE